MIENIFRHDLPCIRHPLTSPHDWRRLNYPQSREDECLDFKNTSGSHFVQSPLARNINTYIFGAFSLIIQQLFWQTFYQSPWQWICLTLCWSILFYAVVLIFRKHTSWSHFCLAMCHIDSENTGNGFPEIINKGFWLLSTLGEFNKYGFLQED